MSLNGRLLLVLPYLLVAHFSAEAAEAVIPPALPQAEHQAEPHAEPQTDPEVRQQPSSSPLPPPKPVPGQALRPDLANAFIPYEPLYFLVEPDSLNAKLQVSFAVMVVGRAVKPVGADERRDGLYFGYTQVSFWDLEADSKPFFDNNYRPEGWWHQGGIPGRSLGIDSIALEAGIGHESNGQSGELSRSINYLMLRPLMRWDLSDVWQMHLAPQLNYPVGSLAENPDITHYRGIFKVKADAVCYNGVKLAVSTSLGTGLDRGSVQMDISYPLTDLTSGWINCFVYSQWFSGWGESLRGYDERTDRVLFGLAFIR